MKEIRVDNVYNTIIDFIRKNKDVIRGGGALNYLTRLVLPKKNIMDRSFETHDNVLVPILNGVREELCVIKTLSSTITIDFDKYLTDVETLSKNICEIERDTQSLKNAKNGSVHSKDYEAKELYGPDIPYGTIFGNYDKNGVNGYKECIKKRNNYHINSLQRSPWSSTVEKVHKTWNLVDSTNAITEELIAFLNSNNCKFGQFVINGYSTAV